MPEKASSWPDEEQMARVHKMPLKKVQRRLGTSSAGLSPEEAGRRLDRYGPNLLTEKKQTPMALKFLLQFHNFFSYLLITGAVLSFMGEYLAPGEGSQYIAWALIFVTILNAVFTFVQEYKAEKVMKSFRKLMTAQVVVIRGGRRDQVDSTGLVPGDVMVLSEGDKITADARLTEVTSLKVDHSSLTGESEPQLRSLEPTSDKLMLTRNMVFSGTWVQSGLGKAVVVATGDRTQIGRIAEATKEVEAPVSHLQTQIGHFIKIISYIAIVLGITFFLLGVFVTGNTLAANMVFAIGIIVANVPEGLLPTITLTLSISAQRMAKRNVLVKNIDAMETLGSVTVICSDKTGTLTENRMNVHGIHINGRFHEAGRGRGRLSVKGEAVPRGKVPGLDEFDGILALCNNSTYDPASERNIGDAMELSLKKYASGGMDLAALEKKHPRVKEIPFTSETKYMITSNRFGTADRALLKGAPEIVAAKCDRAFMGGDVVELTPGLRRRILRTNERYARQGFRVLGGALKEVPRNSPEGVLDRDNFCYYGLAVMQDPPRKEVPGAVADCRRAGIRMVVISGDQEKTVESIARQTDMVRSPRPTILTGDSMARLDDGGLKKALANEEVLCCRTLPRDKLRIVNALCETGEIVAVTGDGVNDAPALQRADVGVAMGVAGTEVAKEAADIVLLDDNFASVVDAVRSGRTVYDNIKRFITYILTSNTPEIAPFLFFVLLGWPLALPVLLILAIDLGTDMLPAIGLGVEEPDDDIMSRAPRDPGSKLLNWKMIARSYGVIGPMQTAFAYVVFFQILFAGGWTWGAELGVADPLYMSAVGGFFATVIVTQIFNVFACRTTRVSVFKKGGLSNKVVLGGIASEIILLAAILYAPPVRDVFGTQPFPPVYFAWMVAFGLVILMAEELRKALLRKYGVFGLE